MKQRIANLGNNGSTHFTAEYARKRAEHNAKLREKYAALLVNIEKRERNRAAEKVKPKFMAWFRGTPAEKAAKKEEANKAAAKSKGGRRLTRSKRRAASTRRKSRQ